MPSGLDYVFMAIDTVNAQSDDGPSIQKSADTRLLGGDSEVDSLLFVNLVVAIEEAIMDDTGQMVTLVTEDSMVADDSPFATVASLAGHVERVLASG